MTTIDLTIAESRRANAVKRARERNIIIPTYAQMKDPSKIPAKIKEELKKLTGKDVQINIFEIKRPELDAKLVGESVAQQLQARISYRRAMKQAIASAVRVGAQGIKIKVSGRLGGAEMARTEQYKEGRIPLHTLRADIDYAISEAQTVYGIIGIKVWIFRGEIYGKRDLSPNIGMVGTTPGGGVKGGGDKPGGRRGGACRGGGLGAPRERGSACDKARSGPRISGLSYVENTVPLWGRYCVCGARPVWISLSASARCVDHLL